MPKIHRCPHCSREFKRPEHLRRHCRTHTGDKPYVCHCGACFTRNDLLRRHERLAHTGDSEGPLTSIGATSTQAEGLTSPPVTTSNGDQGNPENYKQTLQGQNEVPSQLSTPYFTDEVEDQDLATSRLDFEAFTRNMGLYIDLFDPTLFEPAVGTTRQEATPLGQEVLQVSRDPTVGMKADGPMPFSSCLAPYSVPTSFNQDNCIPDFILALAALGAQQRYERHVSLLLYRAAKATALRRLYSTRLNSQEGACMPELDWPATIVQSASTLLTLIVFASWSANAEVVNEAFELHSPLIFWLRQDSRVYKDEIMSQDWCTWARAETRIRIKLMAFCFFNLHTIAYNHQPVLLWHEVNLKLPCTVREWHATESFQWLLARQEVTNEQRPFLESLEVLLRSDTGMSQIHPAPSPFGNYVLLHGLLQRIHLVRQLAIAPTLQEEDVTELHKALSNWATIWQQTSESSLNPRDENGPIAFTSVALLGLAHVRLNLNIGPYRDLACRIPNQVAAALAKVPSPTLQHTNSAISALLYSIHALSLPVAIGIEYVVNSQAIFWCCQHSLGSLECAIFLSKWLYAMSATEKSQTMNREFN
ncbi:Ff.00g084850.m01.CDS01 [Fusarium sp. VM40]|nr:Ff.00g084850.m01.CDS01 [Fusarium sp. VM40]